MVVQTRSPLVLRDLDVLKAGIRTNAVIAGPHVAGATDLQESLFVRVDYIRIDRINNAYGKWVYT